MMQSFEKIGSGPAIANPFYLLSPKDSIEFSNTKHSSHVDSLSIPSNYKSQLLARL